MINDDRNLKAAEEMLCAGVKPPTIYQTTEKWANPHGGHVEVGTYICPACTGTWPPEMALAAFTHEHRGACVPASPERFARSTPFKPMPVFAEVQA